MMRLSALLVLVPVYLLFYVCLDDFKVAEWPRFGIRTAH